MTTNNEIHLDETQILQALVDEADLPFTAQEHLSRCGLCLTERKRLENRLSRMAQMARQLTPAPRRTPSLPPLASRSQRGLPRGWGYMLSGGMVAATMVIIAFGSLFLKTTEEETAFLTDRETMEDQQFMAEVARLEENGFPPLYLEMSGSPDTDANDDAVDDDSGRDTKTKEIDFPTIENGRVS